VDHPAKELDSGTKASLAFFGDLGSARQLAKHNIVGKLLTIAGWQPAVPRERRFGNRRSLLFPPRQGKR
jgi:hypothetical protein